MSALTHGIIALSYLALAAVVAYGAQRGGAVDEPSAAVAVGVAVMSNGFQY